MTIYCRCGFQNHIEIINYKHFEIIKCQKSVKKRSKSTFFIYLYDITVLLFLLNESKKALTGNTIATYLRFSDFHRIVSGISLNSVPVISHDRQHKGVDKIPSYQ